ncbi:MAG: multidrug efflux SMR transporter [Saprospiraceae bacterium]|nr:multidrug efflux SMR transporter [Saprospiraceae bacterium]
MKWIYLSIAVVAEVIATTALKESDGFSKVFPSVLVILGYGAAFYFLGLLLKMDTSIAVVYAIWSGAGIVLVALIGYFIYQQQLNIPTLIGLGLIIIGIILVNVNSMAH